MVNEVVLGLVEKFKKKLCDSDSCPSDNSLRQYAYSIAWLMKRVDFPEGGLPKPEDVMEYLENANVTNRKRCSVYTALKKWHGCHGEKCACDKYSKPLVRAKHAVDTDYAKQERTPKQQANWVDFSVLKKFAKDLRKEVFTWNKHDFWEKDQFIKAQLAFILTFHLRYPIRRDLATVQWGKREYGPNENYLDKRAKQIVIQKHKTSRWKGTFRMRLSREMWKLWRLLRQQQKKRNLSGGYVVVSKHYRPLTPNGYSSWITREMKRCPGCEKKAVGCMLIRHCCISYVRRHEKTIKEKKKFADRCMHSVQRNELYRVD